ncbi:hypothetical protein DPEC_G00035370 [Dallia pectoralis]|uniref:Uncharacterized protein n=1 Tax=Dallia pectoralis TaxID=75939 RepID=A0ACC2HDE1_DALPE|nr:hypothetical protein DPEC_G00035370 [Dallia pectoralis]
MADGQSYTSTSLQIHLERFFVSQKFGFLLNQPATDLPESYRAWMDLASDITSLIQSHQLRDRVDEMPVLSPYNLKSHRELRLAHLALGFLTMGYVWQEGQHLPAQTLPKSLAIPYSLVSRRLGLPPILTYADSVLANWRLKDHTGIQKGLCKVSKSLKKMREIFELMHRHVDPTSFHGTLRIFFSGWRDNPMLPDGLLYDGVGEKPIMLSGGSAAQSSSIQCFDVLLGVCHEDHAASFLKRMREYMLPSHRQLIESLSGGSPLRDFVLSHSRSSLRCHYDSCVTALMDLRSYHLSVVARYITVPGNRARATGCAFNSVGSALDDTGTGGSNPLPFLKSIRDATERALIHTSDT